MLPKVASEEEGRCGPDADDQGRGDKREVVFRVVTWIITVILGAVPALCEKLAVLHHREFGKFRRLKGRH